MNNNGDIGGQQVSACALQQGLDVFLSFSWCVCVCVCVYVESEVAVVAPLNYRGERNKGLMLHEK